MGAGKTSLFFSPTITVPPWVPGLNQAPLPPQSLGAGCPSAGALFFLFRCQQPFQHSPPGPATLPACPLPPCPPNSLYHGTLLNCNNSLYFTFPGSLCSPQKCCFIYHYILSPRVRTVPCKKTCNTLKKYLMIWWIVKIFQNQILRFSKQQLFSLISNSVLSLLFSGLLKGEPMIGRKM